MRFVQVLLALALAAFAFIGCGGGGGGDSSSGGGSSGSPEITLSDDQLSFGNVVANAVGLRFADRSVQVTNTGTADLVVGQIVQADLAPPFSFFADNCSGISLAPNASCSVFVRFAPTNPVQAVYSDSFSIPSKDADEPSLTVNVTGNGQGLNVTINKVDTSGHPTIRMVVSVTDGNNAPVTGLLKGNFSVFEGGSPITIADPTTPIPTAVSVALDLDFSESIASVLTDIKNSAKGFLTKLTNPVDEASVIKFAREVREAIGFTPVLNNLPSFNTAIDAPYTDPTNATKFFDAVYLSVDNLSLRANDRLAALVVSDGLDFDGLTLLPASTADLEDVIANAQAKQVFIFTIGLGADIKTEVLQRMAVETGGQYFGTPDSAGLEAIYDQIFQILTNQYEITFTTIRPVGTTNSLRVVATDAPLTGDATASLVY
jgi:VWFA-related protein